MITGASGFIGRNLVKRLLKSGAAVSAIVNRRPLPDALAYYAPQSHGLQSVAPRSHVAHGVVPHGVVPRGRLHIIRADLCRPLPDNFQEWIRSNPVNTLVHLAGAGGVTSLQRRAEPDINRLLNIFMQAGVNRPRLIYLSSVLACSGARFGHALDGTEIGAATTGHGMIKARNESIIRKMYAENEYVILRCPPVYGHGGRVQKAIDFMRNSGLYPDLNTRLSMIHIQDLVSAIIAASKGNQGGTFVVCDQYAYSLKDFGHIPMPVSWIFPLFRLFPALCPDALRPFLEGSRINQVCDNRRFCDRFDYKPERNLLCR